MRRLLSIPVLILLGLSACDSGTVVSPTAPDLPEAIYAKVQMPEFTPPTDCEGCLTGVEILTAPRDTKASVVETATFAKSAGASARLVIYAPDPQHTTVKAWLNGVTVLLPSAIARGEGAVEGEDFRFATDLALAADNTLEVRLTGKPGTRIAFWVEGEASDPPKSPSSFDITTETVAATGDLDAACAALSTGETLVPADWNSVVAATADDLLDLSTLLDGGTAWIRRDGVFSFGSGPFSSPKYYMISADENTAHKYSIVTNIESNSLWLVSVDSAEYPDIEQRVLCMSLDP